MTERTELSMELFEKVSLGMLGDNETSNRPRLPRAQRLVAEQGSECQIIPLHFDISRTRQLRIIG